MGVKSLADALYGVYMLMIGGLSAGLASFIASCGGLIQAGTPDHRLRETLRLRLGLAAGLAAAAGIVSVRSIDDVLPIFSVVMSRFVEIQNDPQHIRIGFLAAAMPWLAYNLLNAYYLPLLYNFFIIASLLLAIIRHRKTLTPKDVA